jgi:IS30 family transposase
MGVLVLGVQGYSRETLRRFWVLIGEGVSTEDAACAAGVSVRSGRRWFRECGGMAPLSLVAPPERGYRLSPAEREEIAVGVAAELSIRAIARGIGRPPSTVLREIERNGDGARYRRLARPGADRRGLVGSTWYRAGKAQARAEARARRPKTAKLAGNAALREQVQTRLDDKHSPEQIGCRLKIEFPDQPEMWVSHETIYQSLYVQGRGALRRELTSCLRTGRALRKPRRRVDERRGRIPNMVMISERPAEVEDRAVPGHWEGDLIIGKDSASAIGTLVERATRFVLLLHLPERHGAPEVEAAMAEAMSRLPAVLRKTLTWDQGSEMANHAKIAAATGLDIYFCDPHSPWQRGSNENTNGLLRQYFPKSSDLSIYPADYLDYVALQLNRRPRKTLAWKTPAEALDELLSNPSDPPGVALTA